jgi:hypothetical protein
VQLQYSFQVLPFFWFHTFLDLCISSHQFWVNVI